MEDVELDEKCLVILEKLEETPQLGAPFHILYNAASPIDEKDMNKNIEELREAGLIISDKLFYRITYLGDYVEKTLNEKPFRNWLDYVVSDDCVATG